ncbi:MAG: SLBB domain-containing protein [Reichenbachiella sp.]
MGILKVPKLKYQLHSPIQRIDPPQSVQLRIDGCTPQVKIDDVVDAGTLIAKSAKVGDIERRIHSPFNGKVVSVNNSYIGIEGEWPNPQKVDSPYDTTGIEADEIREKCRLAGIVGMGGAMTPTHVKLHTDCPIDTVLVNICESEPFLTCDHRVLAEYLDEIECGLKLAMIAVGAENGLIAPKTNNYTSGYERFLVEETLGRKVSMNRRPTDVGVLVINLQTVRALYHAVFEDQPLTQRVLTVDGDAIKRPGNYLVPIGTKVGHILECCGWDETISKQTIIGGPMMGDIADKNTSITAGTGGVLALTAEQTAEIQDNPCIRCGKCLEACPLDLWPGQMERNPSSALLDCIACGACQFVCPGERPLLKNIQKAKNSFLKKRDSNI